jgi:wyosine [tRNA(Phe)-imidazoG37] synthetase (radical SAM superfamily)
VSLGRPNTPLFAQHSRSWRENTYVYPVVSRRSKGLSIGVNLNPDRICNFDCVYCCVNRAGGALKPMKIALDVLGAELKAMLELAKSGQIWHTPPFDQAPTELRRLNDVAFSGDGEPTACPQFDAAAHLAAELLQSADLTAKIVLITNATLLHRPAVQRTLAFLDSHGGEIWAKLDAGNEHLYGRIVRSDIPLQRILENIRMAGQEREIVIQSMFLAMNGQPPEQRDIDDYVQRLAELKAGGCRIRLVQVYTVARPVYEVHVTPLPDHVLDGIAAQVRTAGLSAEAYYASRPAAGAL